MKKIGTFLLLLLLCAGLVMPASAGEVTADSADTGGERAGSVTVTVNNAANGDTCKLYQLLKPGTENAENAQNAYEAAEAWAKYVKFENGRAYYRLHDYDTEWTAITENSAAKSLADLLTVVNGNTIAATATATAENGAAVFGAVPLGYYLLDCGDGTGAILLLDGSESAKTVEKKNTGNPTITKKIKLADGTLVDWTSVQLGDDVQFEATVTLPSEKDWASADGNPTYSYGCMIEDTVSDGLEMNRDVTVTINDTQVVEKGKDHGRLSEKPGDIVRVEYTNDKNFAIRFGESNQDGSGDGSLAFLKLHPGAKVTLSYSAKVIELSAQTPDENNTITLWYGGKSIKDDVTVYDFTIVLDKYDDVDRTPLTGAEFVLMNKEGKFYSSDRKTDNSHHAGDKVTWIDAELNKETGEFVLPDGVERLSVVRVTDANNSKAQINFEGISTGTYYLYEIKAPEGYNRLKEPITIVIEEKKEDGEVVISANGKVIFQSIIDGGKPQDIVSGGVPWGGDWDQLQVPAEVGNNKGALLPSTGGIGTTVFLITGGVLAAGAAILLVVKRRLSIDE